MYKQLYSILIILLFAFYCVSCNTKDNKQYKEKAIQNLSVLPKTVHVQIISDGCFSLETVSNGIIHSKQKAELQFEQAGVLTKLNIKNGYMVEKGDTLAIINNTKQYINLQKAKVVILESQNELNSLMLGFGGIIDDTNSVKNSILRSLKIQSGYSQALLNEKIAKINYKNTFLLAPFNGIVANLKIRNFQQTNSFEHLCSILGTTDYLVEFSIIESELSKVKLGQTVKVYPLVYDNQYSFGKITEINPVVDEHGLIKIKASVNTNKQNKSFSLFEGMNARIIIEKKIANSISIPKKALVLRNNNEIVFTYKQGKANWNYVKIGAENSNSYLVTEGLKIGDTIIIHGNINLAHDADIIIKN